MKHTTIICDKCREDISNSSKYHVKIDNYFNDMPMQEFDFCDKCYGSFIRTVGSWMKEENNGN